MCSVVAGISSDLENMLIFVAGWKWCSDLWRCVREKKGNQTNFNCGCEPIWNEIILAGWKHCSTLSFQLVVSTNLGYICGQVQNMLIYGCWLKMKLKPGRVFEERWYSIYRSWVCRPVVTTPHLPISFACFDSLPSHSGLANHPDGRNCQQQSKKKKEKGEARALRVFACAF